MIGENVNPKTISPQNPKTWPQQIQVIIGESNKTPKLVIEVIGKVVKHTINHKHTKPKPKHQQIQLHITRISNKNAQIRYWRDWKSNNKWLVK